MATIPFSIRYQLEKSRQNAPRVVVPLVSEYLSAESLLQITLAIRNSQGQVLHVFNFEESPPHDCLFRRFLTYLAFKWDKEYQNFQLNFATHGKLDYRMDFVPRLDGFTCEVRSFNLSAVWLDKADDLPILVDIEFYKLLPRQWEYTPTFPIPGEIVNRVVVDGRTRVVVDGRTRVARTIGAAA